MPTRLPGESSGQAAPGQASGKLLANTNRVMPPAWQNILRQPRAMAALRGAHAREPLEEESMADSAATNVWEEVAGGLRRLLGSEWPHSEGPIAALLDLLVRGSKLEND